MTENNKIRDLKCEVQVRTILQHAWAEIEHDIRYKPEVIASLTKELNRKFAQLSGTLELVDDAFQSIKNESDRINSKNMKELEEKRLGNVSITTESLKRFLDERIGRDDRQGLYSYKLESDMLQVMGFSTLEQVDDCIGGLDSNLISRIIWGSVQGPTARFRGLLLAAMGENYIKRDHDWKRFIDSNENNNNNYSKKSEMHILVMVALDMLFDNNTNREK